MSISPLLPVAGAALGAMTARVWEGLRAVPSFLPSLAGPTSAVSGAATFGRAEANQETAPRAASGAQLPGKDEAQRLEQLRDELAEFARQLRERLAAAGIDTSLPIELKSDGRGGVIVDDPHPQRAEIETLIAADPDLAATFHYLATMAGTEEVKRTLPDNGGWGEFRLRLAGGKEQILFE